MTATEAEKAGLVARMFSGSLILETLKVAAEIASFSQSVVMMIKESVNRAFESSLREGILFERRVFHAVSKRLQHRSTSSGEVDSFMASPRTSA